MALSRAVKLQQIQCVVAAARQGSFRRAAAALNLQQSSVSRSVQELEAHLGAPLFKRGAGGVQLTEVGTRFLAEAELALVQLSRAALLAGAAGENERNTVRIGAASIPGSGPLPEVLLAFKVAWPKHRFALHEAASGETLAALHAGTLDLAIVLSAPQADAAAEVSPLWREDLWLAVPALQAPADEGPLGLREVGAEGLILPSGEIGDLVTERLVSVFRAAFSGAVCRASPETVLRLVAMGQGRAIVPAGARHLAPGGVRFRAIGDTALTVSAVRMVDNEKLSLRRLLILMREMMRQHGCPSEASAVAAGDSQAKPHDSQVVARIAGL